MYTIGGSFWEFGEPDWEHTALLPAVRRRRGSRQQPDQARPRPAEGARRQDRRRSTRSVPATRRSPTSGSASAPAPTACSSWRWSMNCCAPGESTSTISPATPTPAWLVSTHPGTAEHGLFARDEQGRPGRRRGQRQRAAGRGRRASRGSGARRCSPTGGGARRCSHCWPSATATPTTRRMPSAERCGIAAATIQRIAAEIGHVAFDAPIVGRPALDRHRRAARMTRFLGRPVAMHAMRGISAHANGFQTCRALHLLQLLIGSVDVPGGWRYKPPYPRPCPPGPRPSAGRRRSCPASRCPARRWAFRAARRICCCSRTARRCGIDKAFSWDAPLAVHGMLQTVIANAWRGDPYPVEVLFLYMANMAWNSAHEPGRDHAHAGRQGPGYRRLPDPQHSSMPTPIHSETVAYADLVLPDTTYLERWDCISLLDRPIGTADGPATPSASRWCTRPRRAPVPGRADRSRRAPAAAGLRLSRRGAALSRRLSGLSGPSRA